MSDTSRHVFLRKLDPPMIDGAAARPQRIQRQRTKGWRMPPGAFYVGRPTQWGNPFRLGSQCDQKCREDAVREFRSYVLGQLENGTGYPLAALRGKDLACWCRLDQPCHADVLLELANA